MSDIEAYSWEEPHGWNGGGIVTKEEIAQSNKDISLEQDNNHLWKGRG